MTRTIGLRREDKNHWERRAPVTPDDVGSLIREHGLGVVVQPSAIRCFPDAEYQRAGATVREDLGAAGLVLAIKEVPTRLLAPGKVYAYFAHVIKGQAHNMPMLARLLELGCSLVDYERIVDDSGRRLLFFGVQAGQAGMIETLWCLGHRLEAEGIPTPLTEVRHAYEYEDFDAACAHLREAGERLRRDGLPEEIRPLAIGVAGYGNVSRGAQQVLACLPADQVPPEALGEAGARGGRAPAPIVWTVFHEEHLVRPRGPGAPFQLQEYYTHPERYAGCFEEHLDHLDVLVNAIYWDERYPRLVTRDWVQRRWKSAGQRPRLRVIGDISCDLEGGIEITLHPTEPDAPCFVYAPARDVAQPGLQGDGPVVMAVDNLPCELPRSASQQFSAVLREMVPALAGARWDRSFEALELPPALRRAVVVHRGALAPEYRYLREHLGG